MRLSPQFPRLKVAFSVCFLLGLSVRCQPTADIERIHKFEDCESLENHLKERYLDPNNRTVSNNGMGLLWGCAAESAMEYNESAVGQSDRSASNDAPTAMSESAGFADSAEPVATDPSGSTPVSGSDDRDFTTTNPQEQEVDEPDIVKNDADYVYVIRNGHLIILMLGRVRVS